MRKSPPKNLKLQARGLASAEAIPAMVAFRVYGFRVLPGMVGGCSGGLRILGDFYSDFCSFIVVFKHVGA